MSINYTKVRSVIESVEDHDKQMALKAIYLFAARPFEVVGELTSTDKKRHTESIGLTYKDCFPSETEHPDLSSKEVVRLLRDAITNKEGIANKVADELSKKIPVAVFQLKIAKTSPQQGQEPPFHLIAVPFDEKYEPWTRELYNYVKESSDREFVFPFNRQDLWEYVHRKSKTFQGMFYIIDGYVSVRQGGKTVKFHTHTRRVMFNALRIARVMELTEKFGFGIEDLSEYVGLQLDFHSTPLPKQPRRICFDNWQRYIKKLSKTTPIHT